MPSVAWRTVTVAAPTTGTIPVDQTITIPGIPIPKAMVIELSQTTISGSGTNNARIVFGACDGVNGRTFGVFSKNNANPTNTGLRRWGGSAPAPILEIPNGGGTAQAAQAEFNRWVEGGAVITWNNILANAYLMHVTFFYGSQLEASVFTKANSATQDVEVIQDPGFTSPLKPRLVFGWSNHSGFVTPADFKDHARAYIGMACKRRDGTIGQASLNWRARDNMSLQSGMGVICRDDYVAQSVTVSSTGGVTFGTAIEVTTLESGAFGITTRLGTGGLATMWLALGFPDDINVDILKASTSLASNVAGNQSLSLGWEPAAARFISSGKTHGSINTGNSSGETIEAAYGWADSKGPAEASATIAAQEGSVPVLSKSSGHSDSFAGLVDTGGGVLYKGQIVSWDTDGITADFPALSSNKKLILGAFLGQNNLTGSTSGTSASKGGGLNYKIGNATTKTSSKSLGSGQVVRVSGAVSSGISSAYALGTIIPPVPSGATGLSVATSYAIASATLLKISSAESKASTKVFARSTIVKISSGIATATSTSSALATRLKTALASSVSTSKSFAKGFLTKVGQGISKGVAKARATSIVSSVSTATSKGSSKSFAESTRLIFAIGVSKGSSYAHAVFLIPSNPGVSVGTSTYLAYGSVTVPCTPGQDTKLDIRLVPAVTKILADLGRNTVFQISSSESYDPITGVTTEISPISVSARTSPPFNFNIDLVDGSIVRDGDLQMILGADSLAFIPEEGRSLIFDYTAWKIVKVIPVYSGEKIALYVLHIRGGGVPKGTTAQSKLDLKLPLTTQKLLNKLGKNSKFTLYSNELFIEETGKVVRRGRCEFCVKTVILEDEEEYLNDKATFLVAAEGLGFIPEIGMNIGYDGVIWECLTIIPIYSGGKIAAWEFKSGK